MAYRDDGMGEVLDGGAELVDEADEGLGEVGRGDGPHEGEVCACDGGAKEEASQVGVVGEGLDHVGEGSEGVGAEDGEFFGAGEG